jgi:hypothetical protein
MSDKYPRIVISLSEDSLSPDRHLVHLYLSETEMYEGFLKAEQCDDAESYAVHMLVPDGTVVDSFRHFKGKKTVTMDWREVKESNDE